MVKNIDTARDTFELYFFLTETSYTRPHLFYTQKLYTYLKFTCLILTLFTIRMVDLIPISQGLAHAKVN